MPWTRWRRARRGVAHVRGGAGWPDNAERRSVVLFTAPHPIAVATVAAVDRNDGMGLRGASGTVLRAGHPHYNGYLATRRVIAPIGASRNLVKAPPTALPGTVVPIDAQGSIMSLLRRVPPSAG